MRIAAVIVGVAALALVSSAGQADIAPPPGEMERMLQTMIQNAGYSCAKVLSFEKATDRDTAGAGVPIGVDTSVVDCAEGKSYLVAWQAHPQPPPTDVRLPFVKPIRK